MPFCKCPLLFSLVSPYQEPFNRNDIITAPAWKPQKMSPLAVWIQFLYWTESSCFNCHFLQPTLAILHRASVSQTKYYTPNRLNRMGNWNRKPGHLSIGEKARGRKIQLNTILWNLPVGGAAEVMLNLRDDPGWDLGIWKKNTWVGEERLWEFSRLKNKGLRNPGIREDKVFPWELKLPSFGLTNLLHPLQNV